MGVQISKKMLSRDDFYESVALRKKQPFLILALFLKISLISKNMCVAHENRITVLYNYIYIM